MAIPVTNTIPTPAAISAGLDHLIGNPRTIHASPESRLETLRVCQAGGGVLWVCGGPSQADWEFRETTRHISEVWTVEERVAARLVGHSPHWVVGPREIRHESGGRVRFWYNLMDQWSGEQLWGTTFQLKVVG
jgi:hypothetical protein